MLSRLAPASLALCLGACSGESQTLPLGPSPDSGALDVGQDAAHLDGNPEMKDAVIEVSDAPSGEGGACSTGTWVLQGVADNARDLGGTPLAGGARTGCGRLYRGSALTALSAQGCASFTQLGIRTVIDLRIESESSATPDAPCVQQVATIVPAPMPIPTSLSPQDYLTDLYATESVATAFGVFENPQAWPVYVHCRYGRDRTGVLAAVILLAMGASEDDVMAEYLLSGEVGMAVYPESMAAVLAQIAAQGGVDAYLANAGVPPSAVQALRAHVVVAP